MTENQKKYASYGAQRPKHSEHNLYKARRNHSSSERSSSISKSSSDRQINFRHRRNKD